jgi:hypothetical protein
VLWIDNLKTGIVAGAEPRGQINPAYRRYAGYVGLHIDACLPRSPRKGGKLSARSVPCGGCSCAVRARLWRRCRAKVMSKWGAGTGDAFIGPRAGACR